MNSALKSPSKLFLIDSLGAAVSALFLGVILIRFNQYIGMPKDELIILALVACFLCGYSLINYVFFSKHWRFLLRLVAIANLLYGCVTIFLAFTHKATITWIGWTYFIGEVLILIILAIIEIRTSFE